MDIIHFSAECYPAAKAGGLGDVVGALPKYLNCLSCNASVVMPAYQTDWLEKQNFNVVFKADAPLGDSNFSYEVRKIVNKKLNYPLYTIHIPGRFDRKGVYIDPVSGYGYWDELERFISFQIAGMDWVNSFELPPEVFHCHDHHTALIPFMISQCFRYHDLANIPTVLTIHNGEYHGEHAMSKYNLLPPFDMSEIGLLEWNDKFNSLASGIKCAWRVSTVSQTYMKELARDSKGLESLIEDEWDKTTGIINGIDTEVWNPETDDFIHCNFSRDNLKKGKKENKKNLCDTFGLNPEWPTLGFIGRLVAEKGADLLPDLFEYFLKNKKDINFIVLGTGDPELHNRFEKLSSEYVGYFDSRLEYNEKLAHQIYAGCDFLIMPSRVEPCGLNQMYAMRYGTVPIVRATGGLNDTVVDLNEQHGYGIVFDEFNLKEATYAIERGAKYYADKVLFNKVRKKLMTLDFSWERSANRYLEMYKNIANIN